MPLFLQLLFVVLSGFLMWQCVRRIMEKLPAPGRWIIVAGFVMRAAAAQLLFWIAYLKLPFGKSLQIPGGLWFFAKDSELYLDLASDAAANGLTGMIFIDRTIPSPFYVQALAFAQTLFGESIATGIALNFWAYLGMCAVIAYWPIGDDKRACYLRLASLAAVSLAPSWILWSLQPLKDSVAIFLVASFAFGSLWWQLAANDVTPSWKRKLAAGGTLIALSVYATAGIRWYIAFFMLVTAGVLSLIVTLFSAERLRTAIASAVLLVVVSQMIVFGAKPYLPPALLGMLRPSSETEAPPTQLLTHLKQARSGFDQTPGATNIAKGEALEKLESAKTDPVRVAQRPASQPAATTSAVPPAQPAALSRKPPVRGAEPKAANPVREVAVATPPAPTDFALRVNSSTTPIGALQIRGEVAAERQLKLTVTAVDDANIQWSGTFSGSEFDQVMQLVSVTQWTPAEQSSPSGSGDLIVTGGNGRLVAATHLPAWRTLAHVVSGRARPELERRQREIAAARKPAETAAKPEDVFAGAPREMPETTAGRIAAGAAAVFLPLSLAEALELIDVGGGKGLFLFAEVDTIFMNMVLLVAATALFLGFRRGGSRNAVAWSLIAFAVIVAGPLLYTINNFGTLFRHREMIFIAIALLPLAIASTLTRKTKYDVSDGAES